MSCSELSARRPARRAAVALAALVVLGTTAACGAGATAEATSATPSAPTGTPADESTGRLAQIEMARQCTVDTVNYADEAGYTTDLDAALAAAGFTHQQWKVWHDALADSPELTAQFAEVSAAGCPPG